jgi:maltokinase
MRWFAGKHREIAELGLTAHDWVTPGGAWPAVRTELLEVRYADGDAEIYHLISAYRRDGIDGLTLANVEVDDLGSLALSDATADPEAFAAYLASVEIDPEVRLWPRPQPLGVEQSNSSVRIADNALFKVLRRPQPGGEREVRLLQRLTGSEVTPRVFATTWTADRVLTGVVMEFISSVGDGWQLATAACRNDDDFTGPAGELGRALRVVHRRLAAATADDPGATEIPGAQIAAELTERLDRAAAELSVIAELAPRVRAAYAEVSATAVLGHQIHGDFHLGQALYRADQGGWALIDFEGEPLVSVAERNRPDSGWRDVAGALRSFDYVRGTQAEPDSPPVRAWTRRAQEAFLAGYAGGDPIPEALLRAYVLDKAIYEVRYETSNRPEWVHIPLQTVQDELTGPQRRDNE